jgi:uncharacterized membrane protein
MNPVLVVMLLFSIVTQLFPPKKPNFLYGYQLGNAKKSLEHWKTANRYASQYMIALYSLALTLSLFFDYRKYGGEFWILALVIVGLIIIYFLVERKLKLID